MCARRRTALVACLLCAAACDHETGNGADGGEIPEAEADGMAEIDEVFPDDVGVEDPVAEDPGAEDPDAEEDASTIHGTITRPFSLAAEGRGSIRVENVSVLDNVGPVEIDGAVPVIAYEKTAWPEFGYTLYHVLAPEADDLNVMYFYCGYTSAASFDYIWHESFAVYMDYEAASGSCSSTDDTTVSEVTLNSLEGRPAPSDLVRGFTVSGADVTIGDAGGGIRLDGTDYAAYPFETVDCTVDCSADPVDGWWELHMLLFDEASGEPCFGILYLMVSDTGSAIFEYGFCLRGLHDLPQATLTAAWTAPSGGGGSRKPWGPRHPTLGYVLRPSPR
jgi:hypothetical protein